MDASEGVKEETQSLEEIKSWRDLPQKRKRDLKMWILEGFFAQINVILVGGKYLTELSLRFGANAFHIGLISSLPFILQSATIISSYLCNKIGSRRTVTVAGIFLTRVIWFAVIPLIFLKEHLGEYTIIIFIIFYGLMSFGGAIAGNAYTLWMRDAVPEKIRGRYFGFKTAVLSFLTILIDFIASRSRDYFASFDKKDLFYLITLSIAFIAAVINLKLIKGRWEPKWEHTKSPGPFTLIKDFLHNKNFLVLSRSMFFWNMGVGISSPFFSVHMLTFLDMNFTQIWIYTLLALFMGLSFNFIWGHLMDRVGSKAVVIFNATIISAIPLLWLIATPKNLLPIYIDAIITGVCWTGFNLAMFNIPMVLAPKKEQSFLISIFLAIAGISFGLGSILGGVIAYYLRHFVTPLLGHVYINYHLLFIISSILRGLGVLQFHKIKDAKSKGVIYMFQFMGLEIQKRYFIMRNYIFMPKNEKTEFK